MSRCVSFSLFVVSLQTAFPVTHLNCARTAQSNKSSLLSSKPFLQVLVSLLDHHIRADTGALVINALLEFFTYAVCDPYSDTTSNEHFDTVLDILANTCGRRYVTSCSAAAEVNECVCVHHIVYMVALHSLLRQ